MIINFELTDKQYGKFCDALVLDDDHIFSDEELNLMKQTRYDNWYAIITAVFEEVVEWPTDIG